MRLFIAEKPSVAKAIAEALGVTSKGDGYIECGTDNCLCLATCWNRPSRTSTRGRRAAQQGRQENLAHRRAAHHPGNVDSAAKDDAKKQLAVIGKLIKEAGEIVNAGDPDREGQLLVDEVLHHFKANKPTRRFWVSAQDTVTVKRGLAALKENNTYRGWADAARGRARADWLIGMNLSRAYTLRAQRGGSRALLTVGRVQTPTLALVVNRDREIEAFKPVPYHTIRAAIQHEGGTFMAAWKAKEDQAGLTAKAALSIPPWPMPWASIRASQAALPSTSRKRRSRTSRWRSRCPTLRYWRQTSTGTAPRTLNTCQSLYETHKLTSYPRTDCAYLPESQHADAANVLDAVKHVNPELAGLVDAADPRIKSKTWNDSKITAHHGIVPTMHKGNKAGLSERERNIYELIVRAYIAQFYPLHEYMQTTVGGRGRRDVRCQRQGSHENGWRDVYDQADEDTDKEQDDSDSQRLPTMK